VVEPVVVAAEHLQLEAVVEQAVVLVHIYKHRPLGELVEV
jgi:hypothetical protein